MTIKQAQQLKKENAIQDRISTAIAEIRIASIKMHIQGFENGYLTADEFLKLTDNMLQDEFKQAIGRV